MVRIVNVDVLDDKEPVLLVQRYIFDDRTLLVFRKPTEEDGGDFRVSPEVEIDRSLYWSVDRAFFFTAENLADDNLLEQIALIYRDEDNAPTRDVTHMSDADPYASIVYDPEAGLYNCEPTYSGYDALKGIAQPSFHAALYQAVDTLHDLLAQNGD